MSEPIARPFPRAALFAAAGMVALTIISAGVGRLTGAHIAPPEADPTLTRELRFVDQPDGGIVVSDAADGRAAGAVAPGADGFIRALMRGLATQRKLRQIGPETPFRLIAWSDGRLTLDDPATGRHVELEAFGQTNAQSFARFLPSRALPETGSTQ